MLRPVSLIHIYRSFSAVLLFSMLLVSCSSVSTPISNNSQPEAEIIQNSATVTVTQNPTVTTTPTVQPTQSFPVIAGTTIPTPWVFFNPQIMPTRYNCPLGKSAIYQLLLSPKQKTLAVLHLPVCIYMTPAHWKRYPEWIRMALLPTAFQFSQMAICWRWPNQNWLSIFFVDRETFPVPSWKPGIRNLPAGWIKHSRILYNFLPMARIYGCVQTNPVISHAGLICQMDSKNNQFL